MVDVKPNRWPSTHMEGLLRKATENHEQAQIAVAARPLHRQSSERKAT